MAVMILRFQLSSERQAGRARYPQRAEAERNNSARWGHRALPSDKVRRQSLRQGARQVPWFRLCRPGDRRALPVANCAGMTVLELLVVVAIIGILSVLAVPAIRALTRSNTISSANRQLLDDIALARQRAINEHSIVHVLFVQTNVLSMNPNTKNPQNGKVLGNLMTGGQTRYALYAERTAGDQPGQHHPRYLTGWHTLPEGVFFADRPEDTPPGGLSHLEKFLVPFFPTLNGGLMDLPHIAFDDSGALVDVNGNRRPGGEYIELARGSIMFQRDTNNAQVIFFDAREIPPRNSVDNFDRVRIDGLTGRARIERPEIQ